MISYKKIFNIIVWILFISFLAVYFAQANGYYEDVQNKKTTLTEEKIKQFEKDVKDGKEIKVENYIVNIKKDYSNKISDFGLITSKVFGSTFKWGINKVFSGLDKVVNN